MKQDTIEPPLITSTAMIFSSSERNLHFVGLSGNTEKLFRERKVNKHTKILKVAPT